MIEDCWERWAILKPSGALYIHDCDATEGDAWRVALGWPDLAEIEAAKRLGARAFRVTIVPSENSMESGRNRSEG